MPELQFDTRILSKDGTAYLTVRGPFEIVNGEERSIGFELRIIPVSSMEQWEQIVKVEEVGDAD